jgi:hypothetical protein
MIAFINYFLSGFLFGIFCSLLTLFYLLSYKPPADVVGKVDDDISKSKRRNIRASFFEMATLEDMSKEVDVLEEALKKLNHASLQEAKEVKVNQDAQSAENSEPRSAQELENSFLDMVKSTKLREKTIKSLTTFYGDIAKVFNNLTREFTKISNSASHNVSKNSSDNKIDRCWMALAGTIEYLSMDSESAADSLGNHLVGKLQTLQEEHSIMSKRCQQEGLIMLNNIGLFLSS